VDQRMLGRANVPQLDAGVAGNGDDVGRGHGKAVDIVRVCFPGMMSADLWGRKAGGAQKHLLRRRGR
jgi:hypothetical protein